MVCVITGTLPPNEANVKNGGKMTISRDDAVLTSHRQSSFSKCHNNVKKCTIQLSANASGRPKCQGSNPGQARIYFKTSI